MYRVRTWLKHPDLDLAHSSTLLREHKTNVARSSLYRTTGRRTAAPQRAHPRFPLPFGGGLVAGKQAPPTLRHPSPLRHPIPFVVELGEVERLETAR